MQSTCARQVTGNLTDLVLRLAVRFMVFTNSGWTT